MSMQATKTQPPIWSILSASFVHIFLGCLTIFALTLAPAANAQNEIPAGWESYLDRPDIFSVPVSQNENLGENWELLKKAHFSFVAELLSLYPESEIYFLARDSEHLYDVARLVTRGTPEAKRIHLLNVSRGNMTDPHIKDYLNENGISEKTIRAGKKVLLVDTGFSGTIPKMIGENFPSDVREKIKTHLIVSETTKHPSSRTFLVHVNPGVNERFVATMHGSIVTYEHMPRYTDRSTRYAFLNGRYHPLSPTGQNADGEVSKEESLRFMSDLMNEWKKPETRKRFAAERARITYAAKLLHAGGDSAVQTLVAELKKHENTLEGRLLEAQIRDILESSINTGIKIKISLASLGLAEPKPEGVLAMQDLKKQYPDIFEIISDYKKAIPKLFETSNWQMIGNLIDAHANLPSEVNHTIVQNLFDGPTSGTKKDLQLLLVKKSLQTAGIVQIIFALEKKNMTEMKYILKLIVEQGTVKTMGFLATSIFSQPSNADMNDLIQLAYEKAKANPEVAEKFEKQVFSQPHAKGLLEELNQKSPAPLCKDLFKKAG